MCLKNKPQSSCSLTDRKPFIFCSFKISQARWPTTVTSKQNAHIKFKSRTSNSNHSHQIQFTHSKLKSPTANSNHSHQIQITHSKLKITHGKFKLLTANYKSFTSNTNRSHQIQIAHSKHKYGQCKTRTADCGLWSRGKSRLRVKCRLQTKGKLQNGDHRLGVKCRMKSADCRPGGK